MGPICIRSGDARVSIFSSTCIHNTALDTFERGDKSGQKRIYLK